MRRAVGPLGFDGEAGDVDASEVRTGGGDLSAEGKNRRSVWQGVFGLRLWLGVWGSAMIGQERVEPAPSCAQALPAAGGVRGLCAEVAELADAADSKSAGGQPSCRFESGLRHH